MTGGSREWALGQFVGGDRSLWATSRSMGHGVGVDWRHSGCRSNLAVDLPHDDHLVGIYVDAQKNDFRLGGGQMFGHGVV